MKHSLDSSDTSLIRKKARKTALVALEENICTAADVVLAMIPEMEEYIERRHSENANQHLATVWAWRHTCNQAKLVNAIWSDIDISMLDKRFPDNDVLFQSYNHQYANFCTMQTQKLFSLPGPSEFAKNWSQYEPNFKDRFLCFRPPDSRGLPLRTLHDVFRRYCIAVQNPIPHRSETVVLALRSASQLCSSMGESFSAKGSQKSRDSKENARVVKFDECLGGFVDSFEKFVVLKTIGELNSGIVDGALSTMNVFVSLRQMKGDVGEGGDPYMQVVRSYDLAVKVLQERVDIVAQGFLKQGAPMFLLCLSGPHLLIAGGFFDGETITVEPLGDICIMFNASDRVEKLARVLHALATGIQELKELVLFQGVTDIYAPSAPRIYKSCRLYNEPLSAELTFTSKLETRNSNRFMFVAALRKSSLLPTQQVMVKLVDGHYGEDVHIFLAARKLAPALYAVSEVEGAPNAYVMEYLDPSSWKPLSTYLAPGTNLAYAASIRLSIDEVLEVLRSGGKVHGDLRPPNIMVNVTPAGDAVLENHEAGKEKANIRVVDFNWGGLAGKVRYPLLRNEDISGLTWPGRAGGTIKKNHDRKLVDSWWQNIFS